uniref:Uncharacterized protein n=1 Tax=Rhizophagus irregularis (strain DAOM 181602 / DAOM 197198 / MUCL 43194) TaxID=747089 RepID=U9U5Q9_RHIID
MKFDEITDLHEVKTRLSRTNKSNEFFQMNFQTEFPKYMLVKKCNMNPTLNKGRLYHTLFSICLDFIKFDESDENDEASYVKDQDKVYVKTETGNKTVTLQEVVGHNEKVGKDDEWIIERNDYCT